MTYYDAAKKVLEQSDVPMKVDEIWEKACELGYDKIIAETLNGKMSKTPIASLGSVIYVDIKYNPDTTIFVKVGRGQFLLKSKINNTNQSLINEINNLSEEDDTEEITENTITNKKILEEDLHIPLTKYLYSMKIYSKTINANATDVNLKGKMKWGTPDIVAVTFKDYINKSVLELFNHINLPTTELYAYELKLRLTLGSLTEYYFQALSNSGWANEAWLVAMEIDENNYDELMEEIKRLNQSFGVGVIKLDYDNPEDSEILFSAKKRNYLDIDTMHKLCYNRHFQDFINDVNEILEAKDKSKNHIISSLINSGRFNNPH
ncbi:HTH domain-containing protein [Brachyspira hyodysenteriae]|uniref:HTH domain-containing protein n=1 Tax=Brachyspira hyodysenteriae TaxID=159 RepID=UPI0022CD3053|nr:HTH domain-containing protein [Brachyspira hyodysenteriae]MCZ9838378.1 HTH domain-containing protein [Brachyspira hyodysenteriae]MCZ9849491.1 HTH domain-containing protein [Brachyspira hyodysenteriae]MCZ9873625.1 HTH domain-containing protein [Brachyspira hyodysenteriae]MCZ9892402.1 HTH domain-containing protein [Brachyspira hyodysenteriae]MCZ9931311.1 HTH domain-containing protein [Brachyspira hyodysenteriae]